MSSCSIIRALLLSLAAAFLHAASPVWAQTAAPNNQAVFDSYLSSPTYKSYLDLVLANVPDPAADDECRTPKLVEWRRYLVLEPPRFVPDRGNYSIDGGAWIATLTIDRCGRQVRRRLLLRPVPGQNQIKADHLLPGEFAGNMQLEADARRIVMPGIAAHGKCSDRSKVRVLDIRLLSKPDPAGWTETWHARACDTLVEATVTYAATPTGMTVTAGNWKTR